MATIQVPVLPLLATRGSLGIKLLQGKNAFQEIHDLYNDESTSSKIMRFSDDGACFAFVNGRELKILAMDTGEVIYSLDKQKTTDIVISPKNTYIATWEPFYTTPQNPQGFNNYEIHNMKTKCVKKPMIHKNRNTWAPVWSKDEKICGRCVNNEVQFYEDGEFQKATRKLYLQGVSGCAIAPCLSPYMIAVYIVGKKGLPSSVRLFQYPNLGDGQAITNRSFFKADKVDMIWNKKGNALLILVSAEVDTTGSSYYGEQTLHLMTTNGNSNIVQFEKKGPIYSVDWNPNSSQFCVVYGFMPAKATLFNLKSESVFDFGTGPRNICKYNQHGNILCLAGFGNLPGIMEMWNVDGKKLIGKPQARDTTFFQWCTDGQHLVTATCAPRLRVSNGYKIWHYSGKVIHSFDVPKNTELWETIWQTVPDGTFPVPRIVASVATQEVKKETYRPPSARGTAVKKIVIHETELPENQRNQENMSAAALKNKKKREAKAKSKKEIEAANGSNPANANLSGADFVTTGDPEKDKKIKNLRKKLKQIEDLKAKQSEGKILEKNQLDKLTTEKDLLKELKDLQISS